MLQESVSAVANGNPVEKELFSGLADLREAHSKLLDRQVAEEEKEEFWDDVVRFIRRARFTGAVLDRGEERLDAQHVISSWAATLLNMRGKREESILVKFDQSRLRPLDEQKDFPYAGLDAYDEADANKFFGREELVEDGLRLLVEKRCLVVVGAQASGKSSYVRAGLLPAIRHGRIIPGSETWTIYEAITPGEEPFLRLARLLATADASQEAIAAEASRMEREPTRLGKVLDTGKEAPAVFVINQFEEVLTLIKEAEKRQAFIAALLHLITRQGRPHRIILTLHAEYEQWLATLPALQAIDRVAFVRMKPFLREQLREIIERPAQNVGLQLDPRLVNALVDELTGDAAPLPLLQFILRQLWPHRERNRILFSEYERLGGARYALGETARKTYERLSEELKSAARELFLKLFRVSDSGQIASARLILPVRELTTHRSLVDEVAMVFEKACVLRRGSSTTELQWEVTHGSLARTWPELAQWLEKERVPLTKRRRFEEFYAEWARHGRRRGGLLDAPQLAEAEEWVASPQGRAFGHDVLLTPLIKASRAAVAAQLRQAHHLIAALIILVLGVIGVAVGSFMVEHKLRLKSEALRNADETILRRNEEIISSLAQNRENLNNELKGVKMELASPEERIRQNEEEIARLNGEIEHLRRLQTDNEKLAAQQEQARKAYDQIQAQITNIETKTAEIVRSDITVEFFSRPLDRAKVDPVLQTLNFRVVEKPSKTQGVPTNTVTFGSAVPVEDVKLLVAELAKAGVDIRVVRPMNGPRKDEKLIQVSGYYNSMDSPTASPLPSASQ
jgi:hypothetical protein